MDTQILQIQSLSLAIEALKEGNPIAFPTETVYGLGAPIFHEKALRELFSIKNRPIDNPLIVHLSSLKQMETLAKSLPPSFYQLANRFWPGPLTLVVEKNESLSPLLSAGHPTIAVRMPSHPIARQLIEALGEPLAAPSANLSGRPSPTCVSDVLEDLQGKIKYVIEGGECEIGIESTVVSLFSSTPTLLRPGKITKEELEDVLGCFLQLPSDSTPIHSPGMKYRHYAPKTPIRLTYEKEKGAIEPNVRSLYRLLRQQDRLCLPEIVVYCHPNLRQDEGFMNRLLRAAGQMG